MAKKPVRKPMIIDPNNTSMTWPMTWPMTWSMTWPMTWPVIIDSNNTYTTLQPMRRSFMRIFRSRQIRAGIFCRFFGQTSGYLGIIRAFWSKKGAHELLTVHCFYLLLFGVNISLFKGPSSAAETGGSNPIPTMLIFMRPGAPPAKRENLRPARV